VNGWEMLALMGFIACALWIASELDRYEGRLTVNPDDMQVLGLIEQQKETAHYAQEPARCRVCGSEDISDRQGHIRPDGDDTPPWLLICERCGEEWKEE